MCVAVALILAYVENLFPPLVSAVPGIKMGLPNILLIFLLYRRGWIPTAVVSLPLKYMHTPIEVVSAADMESVAQLLAAFAAQPGEEGMVC